MNDLIINFAPTGMVPTKEMSPHVPIGINEIVENVHEAVELGITIVHLHARDAVTGRPTYKAEIYGDLISGIRDYAKDLIICVSLSGRDFGEFRQRAEPLQLTGNCKPDMGSLTLSSLNFSGVIAGTMTRRLFLTSTAPSQASRCSASRTGIGLTSRSCARPRMVSAMPGSMRPHIRLLRNSW